MDRCGGSLLNWLLQLHDSYAEVHELYLTRSPPLLIAELTSTPPSIACNRLDVSIWHFISTATGPRETGWATTASTPATTCTHFDLKDWPSYDSPFHQSLCQNGLNLCLPGIQWIRKIKKLVTNNKFTLVHQSSFSRVESHTKSYIQCQYIQMMYIDADLMNSDNLCSAVLYPGKRFSHFCVSYLRLTIQILHYNKLPHISDIYLKHSENVVLEAIKISIMKVTQRS